MSPFPFSGPTPQSPGCKWLRPRRPQSNASARRSTPNRSKDTSESSASSDAEGSCTTRGGEMHSCGGQVLLGHVVPAHPISNPAAELPPSCLGGLLGAIQKHLQPLADNLGGLHRHRVLGQVVLGPPHRRRAAPPQSPILGAEVGHEIGLAART